MYELILLSGGCYYFLNEAFVRSFGTPLQTGYIGVKRYFNDGVPEAVISYTNEDNNIDMKYFRKDTIAPEYTLKIARKQFGQFFGEHFCSIWDWGERNKDFLLHLGKVVHEAKRFKKKADAKKDLQSLENLILQAKEKMMAYKKIITLNN